VAEEDDDWALEASGVTKRFPVAGVEAGNDTRVRDGVLTALDAVSLRVRRGECLVIGGANGSGKSLLMAIIAELETPTSGFVKTAGRVGLVFQDPDSQILGETPREDVAFGPGNMRLSKAVIAERVERALEAVGLGAKAEYPAHSLSGGEKRRLAVAGVLAMDADILIFDEPYANLDYAGVKQVNTLIEKLLSQRKTVIILTHELEKCLGMAQRFAVLYEGKKVFDGAPAEALALGNIERWGIRNPLTAYSNIGDLVWR
jgi:biotin transport system ATP-binding protein